MKQNFVNKRKALRSGFFHGCILADLVDRKAPVYSMAVACKEAKTWGEVGDEDERNLFQEALRIPLVGNTEDATDFEDALSRYAKLVATRIGSVQEEREEIQAFEYMRAKERLLEEGIGGLDSEDN